MNILFATGHFGFLRNFEPALRLLVDRGHRLHLVADRHDALGGIQMVERLTRGAERVTHAWVPTSKERTWYALATELRLSLDYWRYLHPRYDQSPKLRQRAELQAPSLAVKLGRLAGLRSRLGLRGCAAVVRGLERAVPYDPAVRRLLERRRPDLLLITPLLYFGSSQVDYVRAARSLGIPTVLCVGSWDHLTTKGLIHEVPDRVTVWNEVQREEAREIHGVPPDAVTVTGAQSYDRWFTARPSTDRAAFCHKVSLDPSRPILLYLCSSPFIAPYEVGFVERWVRAIRGHADPDLSSAGLLIRPHPQNYDQWARVDFETYDNVIVFPRGGVNPIDDVARAQYFDSMYHAAAVVGVNTSALIESGIVGRAVYTVLTEEFAGTQEGTLHFRHLRDVSGGLVHVAPNLDAHVAQLAVAVATPPGLDPKSRAFIQTFVRPQGVDRPVAPIFADAVEECARLQATRGRSAPLWAPAARVVLYPLAVGACRLARHRRATRKTADQRADAPRRILFVMASPEYLRYYDSTIRLLTERGHQVIVGVNKQRDVKQARLEALDGVTGDLEIVGVIPQRSDIWGRIGKGLRGIVDFTRFLHPRYRHAPVLRARMKRKVLPIAFRFLDKVPAVSAVTVQRTLSALACLERSIPSSRELETFIASHRPDVVLVSPLIDAASHQVDLVKSAKALGISTGACIASWDNLTNKGLLRIEPDLVFVWNEIQRGEAVEFHGISGDKVAVTGAQLFDRWFERRPSRSRDAFCGVVGLEPDRPFVLFTCSSGFISESHRELPFVRSWVEALRRSEDPGVRALGVLVRPHPYNTEAWETADLSDLPGVSVWPRRRYNAVEEAQRAAYFDAFHHCAAVVGINTSAMVEAAIVGRPVFSVVTPEFAGTQEGTLHFHHLLPENGGCVRAASSLEEHVGQLGYALTREAVTRHETTRFVRSFIRPHGLDRPATPIIVARIEALARLPRPHLVVTPLWSYGLRAVLVAGGALAGLVSVVATPRSWGKARRRVRQRLHTLRKRAAKAVRVSGNRARRVRKQVQRVATSRARSDRAGWGASLWHAGVLRPARKLRRLVRRGRYELAMRVKHRAAGSNVDPKP